jgi:hypothetical protein
LLLIILELLVTIETHNTFLIYDLLEQRNATLGMQKQLTNGLNVRFISDFKQKAEGLPEIIQLGLTITQEVGAPVLATLIATWLLKKLDKEEAKVTKLEIDRVTVELNEDKIRKIVHEKIKETHR